MQSKRDCFHTYKLVRGSSIFTTTFSRKHVHDLSWGRQAFKHTTEPTMPHTKHLHQK